MTFYPIYGKTKEDATITSRLDYIITDHDKTSSRLVIGYTYSNYATISETIYSCVHSKHVLKTTNALFSSTGRILMIMTTRFKVVGNYWWDEDSNLT